MSLELNKRIKIKDDVYGVLRYIGRVDGKEGDWAGIELDTAIGSNDGTYEGKRYFVCEPRCGVFIRTNRLLSYGTNNPFISDVSYCVREKEMRNKTTDNSLISEVNFVKNSVNNVDTPYNSFNPNQSLFVDDGHIPGRLSDTLMSYSKNDTPLEDENKVLKKQIEQYKELFYKLANTAKASIIKIRMELDKIHLTLTKNARYIVPASEKERTTAIVAEIYRQNKQGNQDAIAPLLDEFKNIVGKYKIRVD